MLVTSVCGAATKDIDIADAELNSEGIICCAACESILAARTSWAASFDPAIRIYKPRQQDIETVRWLYDQALQEQT